MERILREIFYALEAWILNENKRRHERGGFSFPKCEVRLLGQMSLIANEKVAATLRLIATLDLDAHLEQMDYQIKKRMVELLNEKNLTYDEDSEKIWLPPDSEFLELYTFNSLMVSMLDPESALVSKAVKAQKKE